MAKIPICIATLLIYQAKSIIQSNKRPSIAVVLWSCDIFEIDQQSIMKM